MVNRGVGYDQELLPWLETYTFPVEARYGDTDFAEAAWKRFLNRMWANGTLRFSAFATIHKEAAWRLMELTEQAGLSALIGKVNMDRNAPDSLREDTDASLADTGGAHLPQPGGAEARGVYPDPPLRPLHHRPAHGRPGAAGGAVRAAVQSHLSENRSEIAWVGQLHPECASYTEVYPGLRPAPPGVHHHGPRRPPHRAGGGHSPGGGGHPGPLRPVQHQPVQRRHAPAPQPCRRGCAAAWPAMWPAATPPP